jgi:hypothetical protein
MQRVSILAIALLSASLIQVGWAQVGSPTNTDSSSQTKEKPTPNKEKQTDKAKAKSTKPPIKAESGKKTTSSQDAAYALAARKGNPEPAPSPK